MMMHCDLQHQTLASRQNLMVYNHLGFFVSVCLFIKVRVRTVGIVTEAQQGRMKHLPAAVVLLVALT